GTDLTIANGAPGGFDDAAKVAVLSLSKLSKGSFEIVDKQATLWGIVPVDGSLEGVQSTFEKGMPAGFSAEAILTQTLPPPPPAEPEPAPEPEPEPAPVAQKPEACSTSVIAAVTNNTINFQSGRATILSDSFELLDNIAGLVISCPTARFEVAGHTDSDGSDASNQRLSVARAEAVAEYLTRAGVDTSRLVAVGFGESKPIAGNDTKENKALNRRIEFNLIEE
ncbi:MAG: OmpA family protein, partial [Hyphomicrobiales bacterium]